MTGRWQGSLTLQAAPAVRRLHAVDAEPVELVLVVEEVKPVLAGDALLKLFDQRFFELRDLPAILADEMVVVGTFVRELVAGETVAEMELIGDPAFAQHAHGPIDGRIPNPMIDGADSLKELINRKVICSVEKGGDNDPPLLRGAEPFLDHVIVEVLTKPFEVGPLGPLSNRQDRFVVLGHPSIHATLCGGSIPGGPVTNPSRKALAAPAP